MTEAALAAVAATIVCGAPPISLWQGHGHCLTLRLSARSIPPRRLRLSRALRLLGDRDGEGVVGQGERAADRQCRLAFQFVFTTRSVAGGVIDSFT